MNPLEPHDLNPREARIAALARGLAADMVGRVDAVDRSSTFAAENHRALSQSGYPALVVPEKFGGEGASLFEFTLMQFELGQGDASTALTAAMTGHILGSAVEAGSWPAALLETICRDVAATGALVNAVASEPELGSPSRGGRPRTLAERVPGDAASSSGWRLNGRKTWATGAPALSYFIVSAAMMESENVARFVVPANAPGLQVETTWMDALSLRSSGAHDVIFEDVFVPDAMVIPPAAPSPSGSGWFWSAVAGTYLGVGTAALEALMKYANERVPTALGKPIATLPNIRHSVGEMTLELLSAQALLFDLTRQWSAFPERRAALLPNLGAAKVFCVNAAIHATDLALRAAGGASLTRALPLERFFRDARAGLAHPPGEDAALEALGASRLEG
jgi:alkylation response protein AidB-like acyl-CoA dehydrogenase